MQMQMEIQQQPKKKINKSQEMTTSFIRFTHFRIKYELPTKGKKVQLSLFNFSVISVRFLV